MIHVWCGGYVFCTQNWNSVPYKAILFVSSVQALETCCTTRDIHFHILIIDYHYYYNMKLWYTIHWKVKSSRRTYRCKRKWYLRMNSEIFDWRTRVPDDTFTYVWSKNVVICYRFNFPCFDFNTWDRKKNCLEIQFRQQPACPQSKSPCTW